MIDPEKWQQAINLLGLENCMAATFRPPTEDEKHMCLGRDGMWIAEITYVRNKLSDEGGVMSISYVTEKTAFRLVPDSFLITANDV